MQDSLTLRRLCDLYTAHKLALAAPHTAYRYRYACDLFAGFLQREPMLTDLRDEVVAAAMGWIVRERRLSAATASKFRDCVLAAWRFGSRKRIEGIVCEPDVPDIVVPKRLPVAWTPQQLSQLWRYLKRLPGDLGGVAASDWFCSLHAVLYDTGERIGAVLQTEWEQVDLTEGWIVIRAETRKGRLSDKLSKLHPNTCELLSRIVWPERKRVWVWPYEKSYLWVHYGAILKRAGLPNGRDRKFHCLRKTCATHLTALASEGAAQQALGHSDVRMTREVYIDERQINRKFPSDILHRPGDNHDA
jgi:integrase